MLDTDLDDTHLCIKCNSTIVGLENYVQHRKLSCAIKAIPISRDIVHEDHAYGTFDFSVPPAKDPKTFNFNYDIGQPDDHHHHHHDHHETPASNEKDTSALQTDSTKSLSEQYDYHYGLGADVFFSSLELQSSTKQKPTPSTSKVVSTPTRHRTRKITSTTTGSTENDDVWISTNQNRSEKLLKAVSEISGTKKADSVFSLTHFGQDSPEPYDDDDEDDEDYHDAQRLHTSGGKWKPSEHGIPERHRLITHSPHWYDRDHWDINEDHHANEDSNDSLQPPPSYTKGKWVPGTKIIKLDYKPDPKPGQIFPDKYWCSTCNRKLASLVVYERHLKSKLHLKRSQPENELEEASRPLPYISQSKRIIKPSIYLDENVYSTKRLTKNVFAITSTVTSQSFEMKKETEKIRKTRKRKRYYIKCEVCKTRLPTYLHGKHLISHYHYRRMFKKPNHSYDIILHNIDKIVRQSPFQCHPCHFYANTDEMFMMHWNSKDHTDQTEGPGRFWCSFCKFECEDTNQMRRHLTGEDHQEVAMAINRSVPIIIRKRTIIRCQKCSQEFYYNMQLRQHSLTCSQSIPLGTASNKYQSKYSCADCNAILKSRMALQVHNASKHAKKMYFCTPCDLTFSTSDESRKHRITTEHKITSARSRSSKNLTRKCPLCNEIQADILKLKEHLQKWHPDKKYSCSGCGQSFILPQELSRHVRDKVCKPIEPISQLTSNPAVTYQTVQILPTYTIIIPTNTITTTSATIEAPTAEYTIDKTIAIPTTTEIYLHNVPTSHLQHQQILQADDHNNSGTATIIENIITGSVEDQNMTDTFGCDYCEFRSSSQAEAIFHEILHKWTNVSEQLRIPCSICGKAFKKNSLRHHLRQHTNERNFKCDICASAFARRSNLKDHIDKIHLGHKKQKRNQNKIYICSICSKSFQQRHILEQHFHCHRDQMLTKGFPCALENCFYSGRSPAELRNHALSHSDEKNFICSFTGCTYKGKSMVLLKRHSKIHTPQAKDHQCSHCDFKTRISSHLKRHFRIHTGEKPYKCPHCDYSSNSSENLRKHVLNSKLHPGRFLYECKYCIEFQTNIQKDYKMHIVNSHNEDCDS